MLLLLLLPFVCLCVLRAALLQGYYDDGEFSKDQMAQVDQRIEAMKAAAPK
jgi:hypothetical protein